MHAPKRVSFLRQNTRLDGYDEEEERELRRLAKGDAADASDDEEEEEPFVFAITAAGWHSGALVLGGTRKRSEQSAERQTNQISTASDQYPNSGFSRPSGTGRMIYPEGQSLSTANSPFAGPAQTAFRVGLAGAFEQPRQTPGPSDAGPSGTNTAPAAPGSVRASGGGSGGIAGTVRNWVKRSTDVRSSRNAEDTWTRGAGAGSGSPESPTSPTAGAAPSESSVAAEPPRPLTGGYHQATQQTQAPDGRHTAMGGAAPAYARGAGQSSRMPGAFGDFQPGIGGDQAGSR